MGVIQQNFINCFTSLTCLIWLFFYISRRAATIKLLAVLYFGTDMGRNLIGLTILSESYISYDWRSQRIYKGITNIIHVYISKQYLV